MLIYKMSINFSLIFPEFTKHCKLVFIFFCFVIVCQFIGEIKITYTLTCSYTNTEPYSYSTGRKEIADAILCYLLLIRSTFEHQPVNQRIHVERLPI